MTSWQGRSFSVPKSFGASAALQHCVVTWQLANPWLRGLIDLYPILYISIFKLPQEYIYRGSKKYNINNPRLSIADTQSQSIIQLTRCHTEQHWIHTHPFNGPCLGLPRWAGTRKVKPIWIWLKQETVSGSGISWAICKSPHRSRRITTPTPHHSVLYRPGALPATQTDSVKALKDSTDTQHK